MPGTWLNPVNVLIIIIITGNIFWPHEVAEEADEPVIQPDTHPGVQRNQHNGPHELWSCS